MDLIFLDQTRFELAPLKEYNLDVDVAKEKDFELKTMLDNKYRLEEGYWWYIDGTEYGGRVDGISHNTDTEEIVYTGRNFRGIMASRIIEPGTNDDFVVVDGNAAEILNELLSAVGLNDLFIAEPTDIVVNQYQFERYTDLYSGVIKMLDSVNSKMTLKYSAIDSKCHITIELVNDYSDYLNYCKDNSIGFTIKSNSGGVNHLICLGQGELKERYVIHLFTDELGALQPYSTAEVPLQDSDYILDKSNQRMIGLDEVAEVYDLSNAGLTQNYIPLEKQPTDWASNFSSYYFGNNEDSTQYEQVSGVETYTLLTSSPPDWSSKYQNYFKKVGSEYEAVEGNTSQTNYSRLKKRPSDWKKNYSDYYAKHDDGVTIEYNSVSGISYYVYKKQARKPNDWNSNFSSYFRIKKVDNKNQYVAVEGVGKNKTCPKWQKNKYYTAYSYQKAPTFNSSIHYKKVEKTTAPSWSSNTYYTMSLEAPKWVLGEFYKQVNDNYASLVEGGIERLKELSNSESQSVTLHGFDASVGDIVGGTDFVTGITLCEKITNIIVNIKNDVINTQYTIGGDE